MTILNIIRQGWELTRFKEIHISYGRKKIRGGKDMKKGSTKRGLILGCPLNRPFGGEGGVGIFRKLRSIVLA